MTRFEAELNGLCGEYWKKDAEKRLDRIRMEIANGEFTFVDGVCRNKIGRVVMSDMAEMVSHVTDLIDIEKTEMARDEETDREIRAYRKRMKNHVYTEEEIFEMRAAFGPGETIVDVFTGQRITL